MLEKEQEEQSLWKEWVDSRDSDVRNRLFFFYGEWSRLLAGHLFKRYPHPLAEWNDYVNLSSIGLLQAIDRFEPRIGTKFKSFAEYYIRGSILKGLKCYIKDIRTSSTPAKDYQNQQFDSEEEPDLEELANTATGLAFGYFLELGVMDADLQQNTPHRNYHTERNMELLDEAIKSLSPNEQKVIICHYFQCLTLKEISTLLGISKPRTSQLHSNALRKMIKKFN